MLIYEGRQQFPTQTEVDRQAIGDAPFILRVKASLQTARIISRACHREVRGSRKPEQKVAEGTACKYALVESKQAVIIGWRLYLRNRKSHPAKVHSHTKSVIAPGVGDVVGYLVRAR